MSAGVIGCVVTPGQGRGDTDRTDLPPGAPFMADNGCFGKGFLGYDHWQDWLESYRKYADQCAFAVAPDVPFDHELTLQRSMPRLDLIRSIGYPAALCLQNGARMDSWLPWDLFDVLFIAGSMPFKNSPVAAHFTREARDRGKPVHWGRCNSMLRIQQAHGMGCDSADGGYLRHGPDINLERLLGWLRDLERKGAQTFL